MYQVNRQTNWGIEHIASCLYLEDARKVLSNWHAGYITKDGELVERKGMGVPKNV